MSLSGRQVLHYTVLDAKATTGVGNTIDVRDFRNAVIKIGTSGSANLTVKIQGAIASPSNDFLAPDFASAQSVTNHWDYVQAIDLNDGTPLNGDTGFVVTGVDDFKNYEVNINGFDYINLSVTSRSA